MGAQNRNSTIGETSAETNSIRGLHAQEGDPCARRTVIKTWNLWRNALFGREGFEAADEDPDVCH